MISARDPSRLPGPDQLRAIMVSIATLDAILSPEWQFRYYSFNSRWSDDSAMGSMRDGSGSHWFALFSPRGVAIHGLGHESPIFRPGDPWPGIFDELPEEFHQDFLSEPAFTTENSTFCIWRLRGDSSWRSGNTVLPTTVDPDGSQSLLAILEGRPEQYVQFSQEYYERDPDLEIVRAVYGHRPLRKAMVVALNPDVDLKTLLADLKEIGYPMSG
jgi:hypothetical protein